MQKPSQKTARRRIFELDLLRGFFIVVIVIDHLQFWPSPFTAITGEGRLWVTAAEGFFLISGLLIGYIRAYKGKKHSLWTLTKITWKRAGILYLWGVLVTAIVLGLTLAVGNHTLLPKLPSEAALSSLPATIGAILSGTYFNDWIYFLRLYTIMLLVTPLFLFLLRRRHAWLAAAGMIGAYIVSYFWVEAALQWQVYFFGAALIGYKLEDIIAWFRVRPHLKSLVSTGTIALTAITMVTAFFFRFGWGWSDGAGFDVMTRENYEGLRAVIDPWFAINPIVPPAKMALAFLWFIGGIFFVHRFRAVIMRWFGWLLMTLGERSLTAYILQAVLLVPVVIIIPVSNWFLNGLVGVAVIMLIWLLMQTKLVKKYIPA